MSCCNGRRAALTRNTGLRSAPAAPINHDAAPTVALRYRGPVPMLLPSPSGGAPYALQAEGQTLGVATRDAPALLLTGWFQPA
jgi:hypothetical protein